MRSMRRSTQGPPGRRRLEFTFLYLDPEWVPYSRRRLRNPTHARTRGPVQPIGHYANEVKPYTSFQFSVFSFQAEYIKGLTRLRSEDFGSRLTTEN